MADDTAYTWAQRVESWVGEMRVSVIRLLALAGFYANHLVHYHFFDAVDRRFHLTVTAVAVAWALGAATIHACLARRWNPPWMKYAALSLDLVMTLLLLGVAGGPGSPLVVVLLLVVWTSALRLSLPAVWTATLGAIAVLAVLYGVARWGGRADMIVPRTAQVIYVLAAGCAGLLAGQSVRQMRRVAQDLTQRLEARR